MRRYGYSYNNKVISYNGLGADHLIPGGGGLWFFVKKRLFSKFLKINSLFSYLWEKNSLFMKK